MNEQLCELCSEHTFKYTCPKCGCKTCCLKCSMGHKKLYKCDGIKRAINNVALDEMTSETLVKDMNFLMKIQNKIGISDRDLRVKNYQSKADYQRFFHLSQACRTRKVRLFLQPNGMSKHKENETKVLFLNNEEKEKEKEKEQTQKKNTHETKVETKVETKIKEKKIDGENEKGQNETQKQNKNKTKTKNKHKNKNKNEKKGQKNKETNKFGYKECAILWTLCIECDNQKFLCHKFSCMQCTELCTVLPTL